MSDPAELTVVVLADTHLHAGLDRLPAPVREACRRADLVLHAGDVVSRAAYEELAATVETHAVLGNNDAELVDVLPQALEIELCGVRVAMLHDSGPRAGRAGRLARRFPAADLVVYGHSHVPDDTMGIGGQRLFNPGSPTQRRAQPRATFGRVVFSHGEIRALEIVPLDRTP